MTVSGVDVGNLTVAEATARLGQTLGPVLAQDIVVTAAGSSFPLKMTALKFKFRADKTALRALYAGPGRPAGAGRHAAARLGDPVGRLPAQAGLALRPAHRGEGRRRGARRAHPHQDVPDHQGARPQGPQARGQARSSPAIQATVPTPPLSRTIAGKLTVTTPKIRTRELAKAYPSVITIDQSSFRLRLFKRLKFVKGYGVAVGQAAYPTPNGRFALQSKQVDPVWTAPNSPWAGEMGGQSVSGGAPNNPLKARWMGVSGSVGIHGTGEPWSIGTRASHGCIRMTVPDVVDLFDRVSVGTPVLIAP